MTLSQLLPDGFGPSYFAEPQPAVTVTVKVAGLAGCRVGSAWPRRELYLGGAAGEITATARLAVAPEAVASFTEPRTPVPSWLSPTTQPVPGAPLPVPVVALMAGPVPPLLTWTAAALLVAPATIARPSGPVPLTEMPVGAFADTPKQAVPAATMAVGPDAVTPVVAPAALTAMGPLALTPTVVPLAATAVGPEASTR